MRRFLNGSSSGGGARTLMLYAGRVSREKGLERLAAGYMDLRRRRDDVHLVIAGDGPYRGELEAMLGDTAAFTEFLRGEELARTFASCDVFVFTSATDTLGRAVAEAQASGLPAVVCGIGGPRECIRPGVSGFVVDPEDDEEFFARVEELEDPAKRERMAREPASSSRASLAGGAGGSVLALRPGRRLSAESPDGPRGGQDTVPRRPKETAGWLSEASASTSPRDASPEGRSSRRTSES